LVGGLVGNLGKPFQSGEFSTDTQQHSDGYALLAWSGWINLLDVLTVINAAGTYPEASKRVLDLLNTFRTNIQGSEDTTAIAAEFRLRHGTPPSCQPKRRTKRKPAIAIAIDRIYDFEG